jgi:hypothetical protein
MQDAPLRAFGVGDGLHDGFDVSAGHENKVLIARAISPLGQQANSRPPCEL